MGKICKKLKENEIGSIGIGAMIVFIAMVLVAGIAASVLIQTSTKLESQAMRSGQETIAEVSTGVAIEEIEGHKSKSGTTLDYMVVSVRSRAGSSDVDLSEAVVEISDSSTKNLLTYNSSTFTDTSGINGDIFAAGNFIASAVQFGLIVLECNCCFWRSCYKNRCLWTSYPRRGFTRRDSIHNTGSISRYGC
jgi:flagellin FlaB